MYQNLMDTMSKNVEAMFDTAKMEEAMKPVTDMIELNKKTLETLTEKQTALVKSLFDGRRCAGERTVIYHGSV